MRPSTPFDLTSHGYRRLEVWQLAMEVVESIYTLTRQFPRDERYGLTVQIRDAAKSIPSNIAEGNERSTPADQLRFVYHARGSLSEVETQLEIAYRLGYVTDPDVTPLVMLLDQLGRKLNRFQSSIQRKVVRRP